MVKLYPFSYAFYEKKYETQLSTIDQLGSVIWKILFVHDNSCFNLN